MLPASLQPKLDWNHLPPGCQPIQSKWLKFRLAIPLFAGLAACGAIATRHLRDYPFKGINPAYPLAALATVLFLQTFYALATSYLRRQGSKDSLLSHKNTREQNHEFIWEYFKKGKAEEIVDFLKWNKCIKSQSTITSEQKSTETVFLESFLEDLIDHYNEYAFVLEEGKLHVKKNDHYVPIPNSKQKIEMGELLRNVNLSDIAMTPTQLQKFEDLKHYGFKKSGSVTISWARPKNQTQNYNYSKEEVGPDSLITAEKYLINEYTNGGYVRMNQLLQGRFPDYLNKENVKADQISTLVKDTLLESVFLVGALKKLSAQQKTLHTVYRVDSNLPPHLIQERIRAVSQGIIIRNQGFISAAMGGTSPEHGSGAVATLLLTETGAAIPSYSIRPDENEVLTPPSALRYLAYQKLELANGVVKHLFFAQALKSISAPSR